MNLLALESATEHCSAALWLDGHVAVRHSPNAQRHSETLLPLVQELLEAAGLDARALDAVAFGSGPGAFTGLRLACGVAQGLALGLGIPTIPVSTLLALAQSAAEPRVVALLDARMGQVYCAAYEREGEGWVTRIDPCLSDPDALPPLPGGKWLPVGSGAELLAARLQTAWPDQMLPVQAGIVPDAAHIAALAVQAHALGVAIDPEAASPLYLRDKVAQTRAERAS
ncbi:MAG: tRNA (adenosine(37)-N6)-threonylcarbamoyltransferase complex dimerization subunit type 1 TsaB [Betaproteobacteria bacterium]|nr:tRNA (adenosine(37)-N6)-threonylcarbamoyltransferase complex dimerization subunit type 1 TsaB [Betaproteobacteria bacterium]